VGCIDDVSGGVAEECAEVLEEEGGVLEDVVEVGLVFEKVVDFAESGDSGVEVVD